MDEKLIENWNALVGKYDFVYHLGDFCFPRHCGNSVEYYLNRLNGVITLILGNHDHLKSHEYALFKGGVHNYYELKTKKYKISMLHYAQRVWNGSHKGHMHCYGHSHGNIPGFGRSMDVGVDTNEYRPYSLEKVIETLENIELIDIFAEGDTNE